MVSKSDGILLYESLRVLQTSNAELSTSRQVSGKTQQEQLLNLLLFCVIVSSQTFCDKLGTLCVNERRMGPF